MTFVGDFVGLTMLPGSERIAARERIRAARCG
jgi:hypothetical protein